MVCNHLSIDLEHFVGTRLDARNQMSRTESHLLHLSKVILGITIQNQSSYWDQRELFLRPHLSFISTRRF